MKFRSPIVLLAPLAFALNAIVPARAGVVIISRNSSGDRESPAEIRIEGGQLRMDLEHPATHSLILLQAASGASAEARVLEIDHEKKTYVEMKESEIRKMGSGLKQVQSQAEALLAGLPPEMRKKLEGTLGGALEKKPASPAPIRLQATGRKETVSGKFGCEVFSGTAAAAAGKVPARQEVCVARFEKLGVDGLKAQEFDALGKMAALFDSFSGSFGLPEMPKLDPAHSRETFGFQGLPVRMRQLEGSKTVTESTIQDIRREKIDASIFAIPNGYKKRSFTELLAK